MTTWTAFTAAAPDLADRARTIITATTNCVLGTLKADGSPRLSGIDPWFTDGELYFGSMDGARKAADLLRDPRLSLHGVPWESRRIKDGATDPGDADAKVMGRAVPVTDPAVQAAVMAALAAERGFDPPEGGDLFTVDVETVALVYVDGEELVIDRWSEAEGRVTIRRT